MWFWEEGRISVHVLCGGAYDEAPRSEVLPGIDLALLARFVARTDQSAAVREYRAALRASQNR